MFCNSSLFQCFLQFVYYHFLFWRYLNSSMINFLSDILLPFPNSNALNSCELFRDWVILGKVGPYIYINTPNHVKQCMKSNPKSSAPDFISNQALLQCQGIRKFWKTGPIYLKSCGRNTHKVTQTCQHLIFCFYNRLVHNKGTKGTKYSLSAWE